MKPQQITTKQVSCKFLNPDKSLSRSIAGLIQTKDMKPQQITTTMTIQDESPKTKT